VCVCGARVCDMLLCEFDRIMRQVCMSVCVRECARGRKRD